MKKVLLFLFIVSGMYISHAQPTLNAANINPVAGDSWNYNDVTISNPVNTLLSAGANQTWNIGPVTGATLYSQSFIAATGTPYSNLFPGATHAMNDAGDYDYYTFSATGQSYLGNSDGSTSTIYTNPFKTLALPLTYQNTFNDIFDDGNGLTGSVAGVADGYGSIILPYGTISNVLRVKSLIQLIDTQSGDTLFEDVYSWYKTGIHSPVCSYAKLYDNSVSVYSLTYLDQGSLAFENIETEPGSFSISPNPASENVNISLNKNAAGSKINLVSADGKLVLEKDINNSNFSGITSLNISELEKGIYFIFLSEAGKKSAAKKLVIN